MCPFEESFQKPSPKWDFYVLLCLFSIFISYDSLTTFAIVLRKKTPFWLNKTLLQNLYRNLIQILLNFSWVTHSK